MFPLNAIFGAVSAGFFTAARGLYWSNLARNYVSHLSGQSTFTVGNPLPRDMD